MEQSRIDLLPGGKKVYGKNRKRPVIAWVLRIYCFLPPMGLLRPQARGGPSS